MTDCCIIRDLLPLYEDKEVSGNTAEQIRAHLEECPDCREYYSHVRHVIRSMQQPESPTAEARHYDALARRIRRRSLMECAAVAIALNLTGSLLLHALESRQKK